MRRACQKFFETFQHHLFAQSGLHGYSRRGGSLGGLGHCPGGYEWEAAVAEGAEAAVAEGAEAAFAEGAEAAVAQGAEAAVAQGARGKWSWPGGSAIGTLGEFDVCYRVARSG